MLWAVISKNHSVLRRDQMITSQEGLIPLCLFYLWFSGKQCAEIDVVRLSHLATYTHLKFRFSNSREFHSQHMKIACFTSHCNIIIFPVRVKSKVKKQPKLQKIIKLHICMLKYLYILHKCVSSLSVFLHSFFSVLTTFQLKHDFFKTYKLFSSKIMLSNLIY